MCQNFVAQTIENKSNVSEISLLGNATAGFLAAFFSSFTLCPTELIKCKLQAMHEMKQAKRISPYQLTKQILKTEGIKGMFRGLVPTFARFLFENFLGFDSELWKCYREMPGYFFFFGGYEMTREAFTEWVEEILGIIRKNLNLRISISDPDSQKTTLDPSKQCEYFKNSVFLSLIFFLAGPLEQLVALHYGPQSFQLTSLKVECKFKD